VNPYYDDGACVIYHGDCREVLAGLPIADLVLTDPPYGIYASGGTWGRKFNFQWDREVFRGIETVMRAGKNQIIWGGNYYPLPPSRGWLVWWKRDSVPSVADVELAWTSYDMNARLINHTIAATRESKELDFHPTTKPEAVMRWSLLQAPATVGTILDPFMGSGTTLVASKRLGRKAIGIELEEKYCEIAAKRLAQGALDLFGEQSA
jgi:site-specific DNA-methyltransferase (adenine-specific)